MEMKSYITTYTSKYYSGEEIDERLLKGYYDDAVNKGYSGALEEFQSLLASQHLINLDVLSSNTYTDADDALKALLVIIPNPQKGLVFEYTDPEYDILRSIKFIGSNPKILEGNWLDISNITLDIENLNNYPDGKLTSSYKLLKDLVRLGNVNPITLVDRGVPSGRLYLYQDARKKVINLTCDTNYKLSLDSMSFVTDNTGIDFNNPHRYQRVLSINGNILDKEGNLIGTNHCTKWYQSKNCECSGGSGDNTGAGINDFRRTLEPDKITLTLVPSKGSQMNVVLPEVSQEYAGLMTPNLLNSINDSFKEIQDQIKDILDRLKDLESGKPDTDIKKLSQLENDLEYLSVQVNEEILYLSSIDTGESANKISSWSNDMNLININYIANPEDNWIEGVILHTQGVYKDFVIEVERGNIINTLWDLGSNEGSLNSGDGILEILIPKPEGVNGNLSSLERDVEYTTCQFIDGQLFFTIL